MGAFRNDNQTSKFEQHLNKHTHTFDPIDETMQILYYQKKGPHLNNIERFYIRKEAASDNQLNVKNIS